jgi:hypothetical protein
MRACCCWGWCGWGSEQRAQLAPAIAASLEAWKACWGEGGGAPAAAVALTMAALRLTRTRGSECAVEVGLVVCCLMQCG